MLVQALAAFADTKLQKQLNNVAFEERTVPYFLQIAANGKFNNVQERFTAIAPKGNAKVRAKPAKQRPMNYLVPRSPVTLTSGTFALLGIGELKYVLGAGAWTEEKHIARDNERLDAFVSRLRDAFADTADEALAACLRFYDQPEELMRARDAMQSAISGSYVALAVAGEVLTDREPLQRWWRGFYESSSLDRASTIGECLISGVTGPIPPTHPQIRHTTNIGGKAGVALMSFNAASFRSYGWEQNVNSPVSADRALAYTMALNEMLKPGSPHRHDEGGTAYLFWLQHDAPLDPAAMVDEAPPPRRIGEVKQILEARQEASLTDNIFHMVALSANGSRLIVRSSLMEELPKVAANVVGWWEGLQMQPLDRSKPLSVPHFWQLKLALDRKGAPPDDRKVLLWNRALGGAEKPLGYRIVGDVLSRMRADKTKRLDLAALGLLRLCLNDLYKATGKGEPMPAALEEAEANQHPAYVCGRLLALHDSLQYRTFDLAGENQPNSTVADRFYTLVMNSPAIGIAKVLDLGRKHIGKLRRLPKRLPKLKDGGAPVAFAFEQAIANLEGMLGGEPPTRFGMHDKARFALGFYHQKGLRSKRPSSPEETAVIDTSLPLLESEDALNDDKEIQQ